MSLRLRFTFLLDQKYASFPWTHSKYDTVTPPALQRISGIRNLPLLLRILSAIGVTGAFAASAINFALTESAFDLLIWFSSAAGMRISQSCRPPARKWCYPA